MLGIAVVVQLLLYARADWRQGASFGPRWLTDVLPILIWMLAPAVSALRGVGRFVFVSAWSRRWRFRRWAPSGTQAPATSRSSPPTDRPNQMRAAWDLRNAPFHRRIEASASAA